MPDRNAELSPAPAPPWSHWLAPLNLAAYITWLGVILDSVDWDLLAAADPRHWAGVAAALLFLVLFIALIGARVTLRMAFALVLLQGVCALGALWGLRSGMTMVLLIIVAAELYAMTKGWRPLVWLVGLNLAAAWLLPGDAPLTAVLVELLPVFGFQAFAALTAHYSHSVEVARDELARANTQLLATQALLDESARSAERLKLSRELHDVTGHKLTALKLNLARLTRDTALAGREEIVTAAALADELLAEIRAVVGALRTHDGIDLHRAIEALARQIPGQRFTIEIADDLRVDSVQNAEALLRCAQEGITNALRHGHPSLITLSCRRVGTTLELRVRDDGSEAPNVRFGNGLTGMRERLELLGGALRVEPVAGRGVELIATLPAA